MKYSTEVTSFLDGIQHPKREMIDLLRTIILNAEAGLVENVKWNAPNYHIGGKDLFTIRILPISDKIQLILHRGAKKQEHRGQPNIRDEAHLLIWKSSERAIIQLLDSTQLTQISTALSNTLADWLSTSK